MDNTRPPGHGYLHQHTVTLIIKLNALVGYKIRLKFMQYVFFYKFGVNIFILEISPRLFSYR